MSGDFTDEANGEVNGPSAASEDSCSASSTAVPVTMMSTVEILNKTSSPDSPYDCIKELLHGAAAYYVASRAGLETIAVGSVAGFDTSDWRYQEALQDIKSESAKGAADPAYTSSSPVCPPTMVRINAITFASIGHSKYEHWTPFQHIMGAYGAALLALGKKCRAPSSSVPLETDAPAVDLPQHRHKGGLIAQSKGTPSKVTQVTVTPPPGTVKVKFHRGSSSETANNVPLCGSNAHDTGPGGFRLSLKKVWVGPSSGCPAVSPPEPVRWRPPGRTPAARPPPSVIPWRPSLARAPRASRPLTLQARSTAKPPSARCCSSSPWTRRSRMRPRA